MKYSNRNLAIAGAVILAIIVIVFLWFTLTPSQTTVSNIDTSTSTVATSTTATTTDVKAQPATTTPAKQTGQSAPVNSGIPNDKLTQYWNLFKQGGKCSAIKVEKGSNVHSFSGEGTVVKYDGTSELVKCQVDGNLYVK